MRSIGIAFFYAYTLSLYNIASIFNLGNFEWPIHNFEDQTLK